jgi:membrane associated rhomboid family serine protease
MSYYRQPPHRFQGPGGTRIGVPALTPMVKLLMVICGSVWAVQFLLSFSSSLGGTLSAWLGVTPALVFKGMLWQPFTYIFLHSPVVLSHLLLNMLFMWMFGGELERHWGSRGFLRYFLITGTGAGIIVALVGILSPASAGRATIGASGAIYGLIMAYGVLFANRTILFMMIFPMKVKTFAWIMFGIAFLSALGGANSNVSNIAHLGGGLIGYLYLKRAWRLGEFYKELRWKYQRRKFKVMPPDDDGPWVN